MTKNPTPWLIPLTQRQNEARAALRAGKKLALMLYPSPDGSTFRYRGYNLYRATQQSDQWQLIYFFLDEIDTLTTLLPEAHLLIYARLKTWNPQLDQLANLAHSHNIKVINDLDDCVCGTKHIKELFNITSPDQIDWDYWIKTCAHFELIAENVDGFIATNEYLGKILSTDHDNKPYQVIPNSLNSEQISYSADLAQHKLSAPEHPNFTLGYFSGSNTHAADLNEIYPELLQLLHDYPDIKLKIVGKMNLPDSVQPLIDRQQITFHPLVNFLELQRLISEVEVNLAPLVDNTFTNCKSELKFFEAAVVHTPTIATPTYSFAHSIKQGETGFLCRPGEWYDQILILKQNRQLSQTIAENAAQYCLAHYSPEAILPQIESTYNFFAGKI